VHIFRARMRRCTGRGRVAGTWARLSSGSVDPQFFERLESLANRPWQPFLYLGGQECGLCQHRGPFFTANLFIPYGGRTFAAPEGITHYISAHWYQPPDEFVLAVTACPEMRSAESVEPSRRTAVDSLHKPSTHIGTMSSEIHYLLQNPAPSAAAYF